MPATSQLVLDWKELSDIKPSDVWTDTRTFAAYLSALSLAMLLVQSCFWSRTLFSKRNTTYPNPQLQKILQGLEVAGCVTTALISHWVAIGYTLPLFHLLGAAFDYTILVYLLSYIYDSALLGLHTYIIHLCALAVLIDRNIVPLASSGSPSDPNITVSIIIPILTCTSIIIPLSLQRGYPADQDKPNPSQSTSILSFLLYSYLDPVIHLANKKNTLEIEDLPPVLEKESAEYMKKDSFPQLDPQLNGGKRSLLWSLFLYLKKEIFYMSVCTIISSVNAFATPVATLNILSYLEGSTDSAKPWVWILWLGLGPIVSTLLTQLYLWFAVHCEIKMELSLAQLIFAHALRVRVNTASTALEEDKDLKKEMEQQKEKEKQAAAKAKAKSKVKSNGDGQPRGNGQPSASSSRRTSISETSEASTLPPPSPAQVSTEKEASNQAGAINNLLTVDVLNVTTCIDVLPLPTTLRAIVSLVLLYKILGWSSLVGSAILVVSLPVPALVIKFRTRIQKKQMQRADDRLQAVTQAMNVIRMIKLFGWEEKIEEKITENRTSELNYIWWSVVLDVGSNSLVAIFPLIAMLATYACYTLVAGFPLKASLIFSSISLFNMLRNEIRMMTWIVPLYVRGKVSCDRIATFLNSGELLKAQPSLTTNEDSLQVGIRECEFRWKDDPSLTDNKTISSARKNFRLRVDEELVFASGKTNIIIGPTGCGKTSLLMALLGEMVTTALSEQSHCTLSRVGGVAYAAQESWVMNATIRENILFGAEFDEERYNKVLCQTALDKDISLFGGGDLTEVGEKGITLSGGQKARITLARTVYSKANVVLLDDILSALDVHTARWVADECLKGDLLHGRTIILVTHNVSLAKSVAEYMVVLGLDGTIKSHGAVESVLREESGLIRAIEQHKEAPAEGKDAEQVKVKTEAGKLIVAEELALGHVGWPAYKLYLSNLGGPVFYVVSYTSIVVLCLLPLVQNAFLAYWSSRYEIMPIEDVPVQLYLLIYGLLCLANSFTNLGAYLMFFLGIIRAAASLHRQLIHSIMSSTLRWLDTTPISRVLTRCTQDISAIDNMIGNLLIEFVYIITTIVITAITVISVAGWQMLIPAVTIVVIGGLVGHIYMIAQLPTKRLLSNAKSPILAYVQSALVGMVSLRAFGVQSTFQNEMCKRMQSYGIIGYIYWELNRWIAVRIEILGAVFCAIVVSWLVYGANSQGPLVGFTMVLISGFQSYLLWAVRILNMIEVQANSLERIRDFLVIDHEPPSTEDGKPPAYWPASGSLRVEGLSARYSRDGPEILKDITFNVEAGQRVGVVGRTGAGKSSLGLALLRAILTTGTVHFDGLDTAKLNLDALRANMSIIPQSPDLLAGTLRENLDPTGEHDDVVLNDALNQAGLSHLRTEGEEADVIGLDSKVENGGSNFSQGQRQIIALARAFVRRTKILIMDEATAAIDYDTDHLIQQFVRSEFKEVTVITVAHRLQTIIDSDKILVLDEGRVKEWGSPKELLHIEGGAFKSLVDESPDRIELYAASGFKS